MPYMDEQDRVVEDEKALNKELSEELGRTYQLFRGGDELSGEAKEAMDEAIKKMLSDINMTRGGPILNSYMMAQPYFDEGIVSDELMKTLERLYQEGKLSKVGEFPNPYAMRQSQQFQFLTEKDISKPTTPTDFATFMTGEVIDGPLREELERLHQSAKFWDTSTPQYPTQQLEDKESIVHTSKASWKKQTDGSLQMYAAIDIDNYPTNFPDKETCAILDKLISEEKLPARKVIYAKTIGDMMREVTKVFEEYSYNGRKFVKEKAQNNGYLSNGEPMVEGNYYWIEVKPNVIDKTNDMEEGSKSL